jgi:UTP-glucose-1-phosphate uridylyltransferase
MTRITVVIPAAGEGRRFAEAGYTVAKPLIPVLDVPMVQRVLANVTALPLSSLAETWSEPPKERSTRS